MKSTFVYCPKCGKKLFRIEKNSKYDKIFVWCKKCCKEIEIREPKSRVIEK